MLLGCIMGFSKPPGVPCPPNNPHCNGELPQALPIENYYLAVIVIILICLYVFYKIKKKAEKPKVKITVSEIEKLNQIYKEVNEYNHAKK